MSKPVYLGSSIIDRSETVVFEFWYDYIKQKYCGNWKFCYMDTDSFIAHEKVENIEARFDTSIVIKLMKNE